MFGTMKNSDKLKHCAFRLRKGEKSGVCGGARDLLPGSSFLGACNNWP